MIGSNIVTNMLKQMDMWFVEPIIEARRLISLTYLSLESQMKAHSFELTAPYNFFYLAYGMLDLKKVQFCELSNSLLGYVLWQFVLNIVAIGRWE
jgi:hypothetical protein